MEKEIFLPTDKKCSCPGCKGTVVEGFEMKYGRSNGIIGPGHHQPRWVVSSGFYCNICGHAYGGPAFKKTTNPSLLEEIKLLMDSRKAVLKKIPKKNDYRVSKEKKLEKPIIIPGGHTELLIRSTIEPGDITKPDAPKPEIMRKLRPGTILYILPTGSGVNFYSKHYAQVTFGLGSKKEKFYVPKQCLKDSV